MAFKLYDRDKDGYITKAEMVKLSKNLTKEQVEKVLVHDLIILSIISQFIISFPTMTMNIIYFNFRHFQSLIVMVMES